MHLPAISSSGMFSLLATDQALALSKVTGLSVSDPKQLLELEHLIFVMTKVMTPQMSGLVLSSEVGYPAISQKHMHCGPIFCLERKLIDPDPYTIPLLMQRWNVEAIRNNYALAKLELYYNPSEEEALTKLQMVAELHEYCQHVGIDFMVELVVVVEATEKEYRNSFLERQIEAIQELRKHCDLMVLEFPFDALGAVTVTAELDIPWIVTARDTPYETFKEHLRTALESGAKGFYALEQFLPAPLKKDNYQRDSFEKFITTQGRDRAIELSRIVTEAAA